MSDVAQYAVRDGIAVITLSNPPVNGLGNALRSALLEHLKKAEADPAVKGVVLRNVDIQAKKGITIAYATVTGTNVKVTAAEGKGITVASNAAVAIK